MEGGFKTWVLVPLIQALAGIGLGGVLAEKFMPLPFPLWVHVYLYGAALIGLTTFLARKYFNYRM